MTDYGYQPVAGTRGALLWLVFYREGNKVWQCYDPQRVYRTYQGAKGECKRLSQSFKELDCEFRPVPFRLLIPMVATSAFVDRQFELLSNAKDGAL
jgi:hypothetical protein